jgi:hypothetical protein
MFGESGPKHDSLSKEAGMQVEYDVTMDDLIRFNLYHFDHSPFVKRQKLRTRYIPVIMFPLFGLAEYAIRGRYGFGIVMCLLSAIWWVVFPAWWKWEVTRRTQKYMSEGSNRGLLGVTRLEVGPNGLHTSGEIGESTLKWSAVEKVAVSDSHTYIYIGAASALMVPHRAFEDGSERTRFIHAVNQYRDGILGLPPLDP